MAKLNAAKRNALPDSAFAGPDRSYPVNDKAHARNALARASQEEKAGNISASTETKIASKAHKVLGSSSDGKGHWTKH